MDSDPPNPASEPAAPILNIDLLEPSDDESEPPTPTLAFLTKATSSSFFQKPPRAETVIPTSSLSSLAPIPDPVTSGLTGRKRSRKKVKLTVADEPPTGDVGSSSHAHAPPPKKRRRKKKRTGPPTFVPIPGIDIPSSSTKPKPKQPPLQPKKQKPPFTNIVLCVSCIPNPARSTIRSHCVELGGTYVQRLTPEVTHLIVPEDLTAITPKVRAAKLAKPPAIIVSSDWIDVCVEKKRKVTERPYLMFSSTVRGRGRTGKKGSRSGLDVGGDEADGFVLGLMDDLDEGGYDDGDGFVVDQKDGANAKDDGVFVLRRDQDEDEDEDDLLFIGNVVDEPDGNLEELDDKKNSPPQPQPQPPARPKAVPQHPKKSAPALAPALAPAPAPAPAPVQIPIPVPVSKTPPAPGAVLAPRTQPASSVPPKTASQATSVSPPPLKKKKPKAQIPLSSSIESLKVLSGPGVVLLQDREEEIHKSLLGIMEAAPALKESIMALKKHVDSVFDRTIELLRTTGDGYRIFDPAECVNFPPRAIPRDVKLCIRTNSDVVAQVQRLQQCKEEYDAVLDLRLRCEGGKFEIDLPSLLGGSAFFIDPVTIVSPDSRRHLKMLIYRCGGVVVSDPHLAPPEGRSLIVLVREGVEELEDARRAAFGPQGVVVESSFVTECWNKKRLLPLAAFEVVC